ncbi:hypothetical protein HDU82_007206 [Entophlyctis luteolus]|nr:hypothetical protein HDU82_007206 [Entophlyctis luteolus]
MWPSRVVSSSSPSSSSPSSTSAQIERGNNGNGVRKIDQLLEAMSEFILEEAPKLPPPPPPLLPPALTTTILVDGSLLQERNTTGRGSFGGSTSNDSVSIGSSGPAPKAVQESPVSPYAGGPSRQSIDSQRSSAMGSLLSEPSLASAKSDLSRSSSSSSRLAGEYAKLMLLQQQQQQQLQQQQFGSQRANNASPGPAFPPLRGSSSSSIVDTGKTPIYDEYLMLQREASVAAAHKLELEREKLLEARRLYNLQLAASAQEKERLRLEELMKKESDELEKLQKDRLAAEKLERARLARIREAEAKKAQKEQKKKTAQEKYLALSTLQYGSM